tara:strand:+ start:206 stop:469 length:264 start_codon:yes stop_codon:yes gene_type:complete
MHEVKSYQMFLYRLEDNLSKITSLERRISMKEDNGLNPRSEKQKLKELIEKQTLIVRKLIDDLGIKVEDRNDEERNKIAKRLLKALR